MLAATYSSASLEKIHYGKTYLSYKERINSRNGKMASHDKFSLTCQSEILLFHILFSFYVDVEKACQEFLSTGLESGKRIVEEAECFRKALSVLRAKSDARANKLIVQYMKEHKKTMRMVTEGVSEILDDDNKTCQQQIEKLQELRRQLNELKRDAGILEKSLTKEEIERQGHVNVSNNFVTSIELTEQNWGDGLQHLQEHFEIELQLLKEAKLGIHTTFFRQIEQFAIDLHSRLLNWSDKAHATLNKSWDSTGATNETPQAGNVFSFSAFSTLSEDLKEVSRALV